MIKKSLLLALIAILTFPVQAQHQITDFLSEQTEKGSSPSGFMLFKDQIYFTAYDESAGGELRKSDRDGNNVTLVKDIYPGKGSAVNKFFDRSAVVLDDVLYFVARDGLSAGEIWKTDGTREGTQKVTDFLDTWIWNLTLVGDVFYFRKIFDGSLQIWKSDGTESGTVMVKGDLPLLNDLFFEGELNGLFMFSFQAPSTSGVKLWRSDGTESGTFPLTPGFSIDNEVNGSLGALAQYLEFNGELYFVIRNSSLFPLPNTSGLMKTDGSLANTVPVKGLYEGNSGLADLVDMIVISGKLYLSIYFENASRLTLWQTDGTEGGTQKIYDKLNGGYFAASNLVNANGILLFSGLHTNGGTSLLTLDTGTSELKEVVVLNPDQTYPSRFLYNFPFCRIHHLSAQTYFISVPLYSGENQGWVIDIAAPNTQRVQSLDSVAYVFVLDEQLFYPKYSANYGIEWWKYELTSNQSSLVGNINQFHDGLFYPELARVESTLFITADDGVSGQELWRYRSPIDQLSLVKDLRSGELGSFPQFLVPFNNQLYFSAFDDTHGYELWKSDGTSSGTDLLLDIEPGPLNSRPQWFSVHKNHLYFVVYKGGTYHLCKTQGQTVEFIRDFGLNSFGVAFRGSHLTSAGNYLYMLDGSSLWASDGTLGGEVKLKDIYQFSGMIEVNGKLFFTGTINYLGEHELWISDGTPSGTQHLKDFKKDNLSPPDNLIAYNGKLYFSAYTKENGRELWQSDGTEAGTFQVLDINPGPANGLTNASFCIYQGELYFMANDGVNGPELWKTNGQAAGTFMVSDINPGEIGSFPAELIATEEFIYFQAYDPDHGMEVWQSDGTSEGTQLAGDILPGPKSSSPYDFISVEGEIYFIAATESHGEQVWTLKSSIIDPEDISLVIYPNPTEGQVYVQASASIQSYSLIDMQGRQVYKKQPFVNSGIDLEGLAPGIYGLILELGDRQIVKKVVKK